MPAWMDKPLLILLLPLLALARWAMGPPGDD